MLEKNKAIQAEEVQMDLSIDQEIKKLEELKGKLEEIKTEFATVEPNLSIELKMIEQLENGMSISDSKSFVQVLNSAFNGVFRMSPDVDGLVETSNNVARVEVKDGQITVLNLTRSSVESGKAYLSQVLQSTFELGSFDVEFSGSYPGWKANPNSEILDLMKKIYTDKFGAEPRVVACHAGLECGIIGRNYPGLDMISFGPNISGAHSPDEKVEVKSVEKYWSCLLEVLQAIPVK